MNILKSWFFLDFKIFWTVLIAIIWVKAQRQFFLVIFLILLFFYIFSIFILLTHYLLKPICLYEFDTILFIYLIDRYSFLLKGEKEVNELWNLVCVVQLFLLWFFKLSFLSFNLDHKVKLLFWEKCLWRSLWEAWSHSFFAMKLLYELLIFIVQFSYFRCLVLNLALCLYKLFWLQSQCFLFFINFWIYLF